jgi:hypothetical protein
MFQELFKHSQLLDLPILSMVLFMATFALVIAWVFAKRRKVHYESLSLLPIEDAADGVAEREEP